MPPDSTRALVCAACGLDVESPDTRRNRALSARRRSSIAADSTRAEHPSTGNPYIIKSIYSETKLPAREDRLEAPLRKSRRDRSIWTMRSSAVLKEIGRRCIRSTTPKPLAYWTWRCDCCIDGLSPKRRSTIHSCRSGGEPRCSSLHRFRREPGYVSSFVIMP
jgi:hypothetical protein